MINLLKHPIESIRMAPVPYSCMAINLGSAALNASLAMEASKTSGDAFSWAVVNLSAAAIFAIWADKTIELTIEIEEQRNAKLHKRNFNYINGGLNEPTDAEYFDRQGTFPDLTTEECSRRRIDTSKYWTQQNDMKIAEQRESRLPHPLVINQAGEVVAGVQFKFAPENFIN